MPPGPPFTGEGGSVSWPSQSCIYAVGYDGMRGETRGDFIGCVMDFGHCCGEADELDAIHSYMIARAGRPTRNERVLVN